MVPVATTKAAATDYASAAIGYVQTLNWVAERQTALDEANASLVTAKAQLTAAAEAAGLADFSVA
jgi:hypothetical protein